MFQFLLSIPVTMFQVCREILEWFVSLVTPKLDDDDEYRTKRPLWKTLLLLPILVPIRFITLVFEICAFPFEALSYDGERRLRFLRGLPALFGMVTIVGVAAYTWATQESVSSRYAVLMQSAMDKRDFPLAVTLGGRLMADGGGAKPDVAFRYAMALGQSGEQAKAAALINTLAPDKTKGFAPAHQLMAIQCAKSMGKDVTEEKLESLRWHLTHCDGDDNEQMLLLWAAYHQRVGQPKDAINKVTRAAKLNPLHLISLSDMFRDAGNEAEATRALTQIRDILKKKVDDNPLEKSSRLQLSVILAKLKQMDEAEKVLQTGLQISKDPALLRAAADFYLLKYDIGVKEPRGLTRSFENLERALRLDPSYLPIYDRLVQLFQLQKQAPEGESIIKLLEGLIVEGKQAAYAHFALSSVLLIEGKSERSMQHLKQAFELSPNMPVVCNNLAWLMASGKPPKYDEALVLARQAVGAVPGSASFRDTLGTILLAQGENLEAIKELEIALGLNSADKKIHAKLSLAYQAIGNTDIAKMHAEKSK